MLADSHALKIQFSTLMHILFEISTSSQNIIYMYIITEILGDIRDHCVKYSARKTTHKYCVFFYKLFNYFWTYM